VIDRRSGKKYAEWDRLKQQRLSDENELMLKLAPVAQSFKLLKRLEPLEPIGAVSNEMPGFRDLIRL
jgi:hypothetical protein